MLFIFVKRKRDNKINPRSSPSGYYGKPPRTPQSLLTMLKETSSDDKNIDKDDSDDNGNYSMDKPRRLEPGTEQFYNMSKSISTEHLHEQPLTPFNTAIAMTTARAPPPLPTAHARSMSSQNNFSNAYPTTATTAAIGAVSAAGMVDAARPESYARPISEYQRDTDSFYYNGYNTREMVEVPGRQSPYNPFRNSEGFATGNTSPSTIANGAAAGVFTSTNSRHIPSHQTGDNPSSGLAYSQTGDSVSYSNIAPSLATTAGISDAIVGGAAATVGVGAIAALLRNHDQPNASNQPSGYSNGTHDNFKHEASPAQTGYTNGTPISVVSIPDKPSLIDPVSRPQATKAQNAVAENVKWTTAPSSKQALATAVITAAPTIAVHESENDQHHLQEKFHDAKSSLSVNSGIDLSGSNVRWTNNSVNNALGVATVEPDNRESMYHNHGSFYSPTPLNIGSSSNRSLLSTVDTPTEDFSSDPDFARWTTASPPNVGIAQVEPTPTHNERPYSALGRSQYRPSLNSVNEFPHDKEHLYDDYLSHAPKTHIDAEIDDVNSRVMHKNAFRLSEAGSLPPIDTTMFSNRGPTGSAHDELLSPDSAVRWKNTNVGSPIETVHAVNILSPAVATVTRRSANEDSNNIRAFEDYYHPKPQKADIISNPNISSDIKSNKHNPVPDVNIKNSSHENLDQGPVGRKSEAIDDVIASRDLTALNMLIQDEENENVGPLLDSTSVSTNKRKDVVSVALGPGAMDGRASSKRMVEEYISSRNNKTPVDDTKDKKTKYKSDFKSIMAIAIQNNTKYPIATEENPHLYYAKFEFSAREHGELGFGNADPIIVVDSSDDIWWMGYKADSKY